MNDRDPFGIYTPVPNPRPVATGSGGGGLNTIIVCVLVAVAAIIAWDRFAPSDWRFDRDRQEQNDRNDDQRKDEEKEKDEQSVSVDSGYLFFIHERNLMTFEQQQMLDTAKAFCEKNTGFSWRSYDDEAAAASSAAKPILDYAKSQGVEPPCLVFKSDGKFRSAVPWPATEAAMRKAIK